MQYYVQTTYEKDSAARASVELVDLRAPKGDNVVASFNVGDIALADRICEFLNKG